MRPEDDLVSETLTPSGRRIMEACSEAGAGGREFTLEEVLAGVEKRGGKPSRQHAMRFIREISARLRLADRPYPARVSRRGVRSKARYKFVGRDLARPEERLEPSITAAPGEPAICCSCGCELGEATEELPADHWWACDDCAEDHEEKEID